MSIRRLCCLVTCLHTLLVTSSAHAWWQAGHSAICDLALRSVTPSVRAEVEQLLTEPFSEACSWADDIRPDRPDTSPWHYINSTPELRSFRGHPRPEQGDILTAIDQQSELLRHSKDSNQRAEALRWLGHLVGDLHQPMHVAFESDWGGNRYRLALSPELRQRLDEDRPRVNMHAVWDGLILRYAVAKSGKPIAQLLAETEAEPNGDAITWADEGLALLHKPDLHYWPGTRLETLSEDYLAAHQALTFQRLKLAGLRLAKLLNALMDDSTKPHGASDGSSSH